MTSELETTQSDVSINVINTFNSTTNSRNAKLFENIFRTPSSAALIDYFMVSREFDYTEAELVRKTGLTSKTVSKELENLVERGILKVTRTVGRSKMYGLNNSPEVDLFLQYCDIIIKKTLKKLAENHKE